MNSSPDFRVMTPMMAAVLCYRPLLVTHVPQRLHRPGSPAAVSVKLAAYVVVTMRLVVKCSRGNGPGCTLRA
jgi:hypothetical protein